MPTLVEAQEIVVRGWRLRVANPQRGLVLIWHAEPTARGALALALSPSRLTFRAHTLPRAVLADVVAIATVLVAAQR